MWVIQEVVIAAEATLICGRHRIPFDAMITALPTVVRNPIEIGFNVESYGGDNPDGYSLLMEWVYRGSTFTMAVLLNCNIF